MFHVLNSVECNTFILSIQAALIMKLISFFVFQTSHHQIHPKIVFLLFLHLYNMWCQMDDDALINLHKEQELQLQLWLFARILIIHWNNIHSCSHSFNHFNSQSALLSPYHVSLVTWLNCSALFQLCIQAGKMWFEHSLQFWPKILNSIVLNVSMTGTFKGKNVQQLVWLQFQCRFYWMWF